MHASSELLAEHYKDLAVRALCCRLCLPAYRVC